MPLAIADDEPVRACKLERLFGGGGGTPVPPTPGATSPGSKPGADSESPSASSVWAKALGIPPPAPMNPPPPREPNMAFVAQPLVVVGKEKRSGEMRPSW